MYRFLKTVELVHPTTKEPGAAYQMLMFTSLDQDGWVDTLSIGSDRNSLTGRNEKGKLPVVTGTKLYGLTSDGSTIPEGHLCLTSKA